MPVDCGNSRPIGANALNRERQIFYTNWTELDVSKRCRIQSEINADSRAGRNVGCGQNMTRGGQRLGVCGQNKTGCGQNVDICGQKKLIHLSKQQAAAQDFE